MDGQGVGITGRAEWASNGKNRIGGVVENKGWFGGHDDGVKMAGKGQRFTNFIKSYHILIL